MSTEKEFDYQAYMRDLPRSDENASNPVKIHRGPEAREKRREAAKARNSQKDITTVAQFHARLEGLDAEKKPFLYRGQSNSHQPVNCSAARRLTGFATNPIDNQLIDHLLIGYLEYLIGKARRRGFIPYGIGETPGDLEDLELLALLQHQGSATGLIDFTRQPLAALWFACNGSDGKEGAVYVLSHADVAEVKNRVALQKKIQSFYGENKLWSWEPPVLGNRIVAQSSVFVFGVPTIPLPSMERLTIPAARKNSILRELETVYGINEEELFPDFPGYAVANSSARTFAVNRTIDYWEEQIDSASGSREKALAHFRCGVAYSVIREYEGAVKHYDNAIHIAPQLTAAYYNRGIAKNALGRHGEAIEDYDRAISFNSQDAGAYNNRAIAKGELGQYEEAIEDCNKAICIDPQQPAAYCNRGTAKNALDRREEAIEDWDKAIQIDPRYAIAYNSRGNVKDSLGQHEEAIADYNMAIRIDPKDTAAYNNRETAKYALGRYEEAIADYGKAICIDPRLATAYYNRGIAKDALGRQQTAISDYDEAIRIDPQLVEAYKKRELAKDKLDRASPAQ